MIATVVVATCERSKKLFGVRMEKVNDGWTRTWAFPITESSASSEGYSRQSVSGAIYRADNFPGCPYCGASGFYICHKCHSMVCYDGVASRVTCPVCRTAAGLEVVDRFENISGRDM